MTFNCRFAYCSLSFIPHQMSLQTLFFWISSCSLCGSCYSRRYRRAAHYSNQALVTVSWSHLGIFAPACLPPSIWDPVPCAKLPLCRATLFVLPRPSLHHPVPGQGTATPSAWCGYLPCSVSSNDFRTTLFRKGKEEKKEGTPQIGNLALPLKLV